MQSISGWAKGLGYANTLSKMKNEGAPFCYSIANFAILSRIKGALGLGRSKGFFFGAAPMKKSTMEYFASLDIPLMNVYGLSETSGPLTVSLITKFNFTAAGSCLLGGELSIQNPDENGVGEVCGRGRHIMMGYLKNEEATKEVIDSQGFFHSGDLGKIDENNFLYITGRIKELIITAGGENIAPVLIEDHFKSFWNCIINSF